jgi:hypothetical protein
VTAEFEVGDTTGQTPRLAWTGMRYLIGYQYSELFLSSTRVRFLAPNGAPLGSSSAVSSRSRAGGTSTTLASVASSGEESVVMTNGNGDFARANRYVVQNDGVVIPGEEVPNSWWYAAFDGREYFIATAPAVALEWPIVAIADRGSVHVVAIGRRRSLSTR